MDSNQDQEIERQETETTCTFLPFNQYWGVFTCSILASIATVLVKYCDDTYLPSIESILEQGVHLQV